MTKKLLLSIALLLLLVNAFAQVPVISSFSPASGPVGASVTINGKNFNTAAAANIVYFGAVKATVNSATAAKLVVTVPSGATYKPITVASKGLIAISQASFIPTYANGSTMFSTGESFSPQTELPINTPGNGAANAISIADFNGDGKPDLAVLDGSGGTIYIFKNTGSPTAPFSAIPTLRLITGFGSVKMIIGDFNGDGKLDIATGGGGISILKNTSTTDSISFAPAMTTAPNISPLGIVAADFNGDGKLDLATADLGTGFCSVLLNTTTADSISFAPKQDFTTGQYPYDIAAGDLDGDGKPDIVIANHTTYAVSVFKNTSTSAGLSFDPKVDYPVGTSPITVRLADIDGDGKLDIITTNHLDFGNVTTGDVFRNTSSAGAISFAAYVNFFLDGPYSAAIDIGDMDGDGKPDIVVADKTNNIATLIKNESTPGTISLIADKGFGKLTVPYALAIGDFTGDGKPDVAVANAGSPNTASVFINDVDPLKPSIASFTPVSAGEGTTVNITGTNFTGATAVAFGNAPAASFKVISPTAISAVVGSGQSGSLTVTTPHGIAGKTGFTFIQKPVVSTVTIAPSDSGSTVVITGLYFTGAGAVRFDGVAAVSYVVNSDTKITAITRLAKFSTITITGPGGTTIYNYAPKPTITKLSPASAPQGGSVIIAGANLTGATTVTFGGTPAASFVVNSPGRITAKLGSGASGSVSVTTPGGTAALAGFIFDAPPVITAFSPVTAKSGATVTITGTNLNRATAVTFGGVAAASFKVVSATSITAEVGAGKSGAVLVKTPYGSASQVGFTYDILPAITTFSPADAKTGATIKITGTNLTGTTAVTFGGVAAASFTVVSATTINAKVGAGKSGYLAVTTAAGAARLAGFTFDALPAMTAFSPTNAKTGATVKITGTNLNGVTAVTFGGVPAASFTVVSAATITAVVGSGKSGYVAVTAPGGLARLAGFTFDAPPAAGLAPNDAPAIETTEKPTAIVSDLTPFPNPFQNILKIKLGDKLINNVTVVVHKLSNGKLVFSKKYANISGLLQVDLSRIEGGFYALDLSIDTRVQTFKIIKN